jgi:hypothetical protein
MLKLDKFPLLTSLVPSEVSEAGTTDAADVAAISSLTSAISQLTGSAGDTDASATALDIASPVVVPDLTNDALDPAADVVGSAVAPGFEPTGGALDPTGQTVFGPDFDFAFIGRATTDFGHEAATEAAQTLDDPAAEPVPNLTTPLPHDIARIGAPDNDPSYGEFGPWEHSIFGPSLDFVGPLCTALLHEPMLQVAGIVEDLGATIEPPLDLPLG